ncbi:hypothetical protein NOJ28_11270 [Neorhizobium galegae]|uniref:hypothetical protein n=1 Tax=Neorhizobium galegae TaxID=399 RepID=UPI002106E13B|nr:hypothetical protein [Neorhizobium galegae]MCQ1766115.1 hypothetical protein [Neorhizobium galegae]MCQ1845029.1 hypothetical protein [Neorhizobium galegae]
MITDKISMAVGAAGGLALGFAVFTTVNAVWWLPDAKEEARAIERATMQAATDKAVGELSNEANKARFNRRKCRERGGVYINSTGSASKGQLSRTARAIAGTSLIGARGATPDDQEAIDDTVAGVCGAGVWTQEECLAHDQKAVGKRR